MSVSTTTILTYNDRHAYTPENPCVGRGICLQHLLEKQPNLTWINVIHVTIDNKLKYLFADPKGVIYTSFEDTSDDA